MRRLLPVHVRLRARHRFEVVSLTKTAMHVKTQGAIPGVYAVVVCRLCPDYPCVAACKYGALTVRDNKLLKFDPDKCVACSACSEACTIGVLKLDEEGKPLICVHCGTCARFCPRGVLELVELEVPPLL